MLPSSYPGSPAPFRFSVAPVLRTIPKDLYDAAVLDGCDHLRFLLRIAVPLSRPALVTVALFAFLERARPGLATDCDQDESMRTLEVGLATFVQEAGTQTQLLMAASVFPSFRSSSYTSWAEAVHRRHCTSGLKVSGEEVMRNSTGTSDQDRASGSGRSTIRSIGGGLTMKFLYRVIAVMVIVGLLAAGCGTTPTPKPTGSAVTRSRSSNRWRLSSGIPPPRPRRKTS